MSAAEVRFHVYKLQPTKGTESVESRLKRIRADQLDKRARRVVQTDIRLDDVVQKTTGTGANKGESRYYLEFVRLRDTHGPGMVSASTPVTGFALGPADYFGEETAGLFLPATGHLLLQFNHFGVKAQAIADYLTAYGTTATGLSGSYEIKPVVDPNVRAKLAKQVQTRRFEVGIDLTKMSAADRQNGLALGEVAKIADSFNGTRVHISISVGHEKQRRLKKVVSALKAAFNFDSEALTSAIVAGRATADGEIEVLDLLEQKLTHMETIQAGLDRRLPQSDRWKALARARSAWQNWL